MGDKNIRRIAAAAITAAALICVLPGCTEKSERELIDSAKSLLEKGDRQAAIVQLKTALQQNPQSGEARALFGDTLLKTGAAAAAVAELERARELKYSNVLVIPALARALLASGQAKKVVDSFGSTTLEDPVATSDLKTTVAVAYAALGIKDRSEAAVDAALVLNAKNSAARLQKASLIGLRFATDDALALVAQVLSDDPKHLQALQLRGNLLLGGKGDAVGAAKAFRDALAIDARFVPAHLGLITLAMGQKDAEAVKAQVAALKKAWPNSTQARFYEAQMALADGNLKAAREGVQELMRKAPTDPQLLQLAATIELRDDALAVAASHLQKALLSAPNSQTARRLLAQTYIRMGQGAKALPVLAPLLQQIRPDSEAQTLAAQAHLQAGDKSAADKLFAQAMKADPNDPKLLSAQALSQIARGDLDAGFAQLESVSARDPGVASDLALINARLRSNDLESALKAVERLQSKVPNKPLPHYLRGRILLQKNDAAAAKSSFEKALGVDPAFYPAAAGLAAIDLTDRKPDDAGKRFEALLALDPKNPRALLAVADLRQRAGAEPAEITGLLTNAVRLSPADADLRVRLVAHYASLRNAKAALAAAEDAVAALPNDMRMLDILAETQITAGDARQGITSFAKAAAAQPNRHLPLLRLADAYAKTKDFASATKTLRRALEISPRLLQARQGLVQIALADRRFDEAADLAREIQKQRPAEAIGYMLESEVRARQQRWDPAISAARMALDRSKSSDAATRLYVLYLTAGRRVDADRLAADWERQQPDDADFQFELATIAMASKNFPDAEARFRKVVAVRPNDVMALNNVAWLLTQQGKTGAVQLAQRAHELRPDSASIMDTLASALAADNRLPDAIMWQRKALAKAPDGAYYRLKLAKLLARSGDKAAARAELDTLVNLGNKFPEQAQVAALMKTL